MERFPLSYPFQFSFIVVVTVSSRLALTQVPFVAFFIAVASGFVFPFPCRALASQVRHCILVWPS